MALVKAKPRLFVFAVSSICVLAMGMTIGPFALMVFIFPVVILGLIVFASAILVPWVLARTEKVEWLASVTRIQLPLLSAIATSGIIIGTVAALFAEGIVVERNISKANRIASLLEEYRHVHGTYPKSIKLLGVSHSGRLRYRNEDDRFLLFVSDRREMVDLWTYDSSNREWKLH